MKGPSITSPKKQIPSSSLCAAVTAIIFLLSASGASGETESASPHHLAWGIPSGGAQQLSWSADPDALSYDVHFGTNADDVSGAAAFQGNQPGFVFDTPVLLPDAIYYWRVDVVTVSGKVAGPVWSFRTDNRARYDVSDTVFENNFTNPPNEFRPVKYQLTNGALSSYPDYGFGGYHAFFFDNLYGNAWADPNPAKIGALLDAVEAQGSIAWTGDDDGYPSGGAGGKVVTNNPEYEVRGVTMLTTTGSGEVPVSINTPADCEKMVTAVIYPVSGGVPDYTQGQVLPVLDSGVNTTGLAGNWKLCAFVLQIRDSNTQAQTTTTNFGTTGHYPDLLNSNAIASWISLVHEPALAEIHGDPASQLEGFYFNEPSLMQLNWNSSGYACLSWNDGLFAKFQSMHGYDLEPRMAALYERDDLHAKRVRMHFHQTIAEMLRTSFTKQVADWCGERGLAQSGHPLIEESLNIQVANFGDMLKVFAEVQVPAVDLVMPEPNEMAGENYHFPKQMSSMGSWNEYDRRVIGLIDPTIGGHASRHTPSEDVIHNIVNHATASGVNTFTTYIEAKHADYGGTEGVWSRVNAYAGRLSSMLTGARVETTVALYYPIQMFQMEYKPSTGTHWGNWNPGRQQAWDNLQKSMISADVNYNIVHPDWLRDAVIDDGELKVGSGSYRYLVMPDVEIISSDVLARIQQFEAAGGTVLWVDDKPSSGAYPSEDAGVVAATAGITPVPAASVPSLITHPYHDLFDLDINSLHSPKVTRFSRQDRQLYFVINPGSSAITFQGSRGETPLELKVYDPSTGTITTSPPSTDITISGYRSVLVEIVAGQEHPGVDVFTVAEGSFENPTNIDGNWGMCPAAWNDTGVGQYEVSGEHFTTTADRSRAGLMSTMGTIHQNLDQVEAGDTVTVVFHGGRAKEGKNTDQGGVFNCTFKVGASSNTVTADTTALANDSWQVYTHTWTVTSDGILTLEFSHVSGKPWLDKISNVTVVRGAPPLVLTEDGFSVDHAAGEATLSVETISDGYQYRLMRSDDLSRWQPVTSPFPDGWMDGTGTTLSITDEEITDVTRRFYRIEMREKPE